MASEIDKLRIKQSINEFYRIGRSGSYAYEVNEHVAEIFGYMLEEANKVYQSFEMGA